MYHFELIVVIVLKVGLNIQINELMKLNEYQRSRSLFDLGQRSLRFKDGRPYLFHSFRNKYFNKISLGNMLYFHNKL